MQRYLTINELSIMRRKVLAVLLVVCSLLVSCKLKLKDVDTSGQSIKVEVSRYDKLLYDYVMVNNFASMQKMTEEYSQETRLLVEEVLSIGQVNDEDMNVRLREYYSDSTLVKIMRDTQVRFANLEWLNKDLTHAFRNLSNMLPELTVPRFYTQMSALNESIIIGDSVVGISLDKYLGSDYSIYKRYYYSYQMRSMNPSRIVPDCLFFYLLSKYPVPDEVRALSDFMVHFGKINYICARAMNYSLTKRQIGFSEEAQKWCAQNEKRVWNTLVEKGLLDVKDPMVVREYMIPSEFSPLFGESSSDQLGIWLGARMIDEYMSKHPTYTVKELLAVPARKILSEARF